MKKLLSILTAFSLTTITATSVVACGNKQDEVVKLGELSTLFTTTNLVWIEDIETNTILNKVKKININLANINLKISSIKDNFAIIYSDDYEGSVQVSYVNNGIPPTKLDPVVGLEFNKTGEVNSFSPDGKYIGTQKGVFNLITKSVVEGLEGGKEDSSITGKNVKSFSPDSKYAGTYNGIFDLETKQRNEDLNNKATYSFSQDGKYAGTSGGIWDLDNKIFVDGLDKNTTGQVNSLSNDGKYIGTENNGVWDLVNKKAVDKLGFEKTGRVLCFSPDSKYVGTKSGLYDLSSREKVEKLPNWVEKLPEWIYSFSPDNRYIGTSSGVYDLKNGILIGELGKNETVDVQAFSSDGKYIGTTVGLIQIRN